MIPAIIMVLEMTCVISFVYFLYKLLWYIWKMISLGRAMRKLEKYGATVVRLRSGWKCVFGARGEVDWRIVTPKGVFEVSVITFISNHSRWNIESEYVLEENREGYRIDVRKYNNLFYNPERHSERPDHALDFRRETRFTLTRLNLSPRDENMRPEDRKILLFYPKPKVLTDAHKGFAYLYAGDRVEDYEVMYLKDLRDAVKQAVTTDDERDE
jgi:hypothetical protein